MDDFLAVALGRAVADGHTYMAHAGSAELPLAPVRTAARAAAPGQSVRTRFLELPEPPSVHAVLAGRIAGEWGYRHGLNDMGLSLACVPSRSRMRAAAPALTGPDLVRLCLERCKSARQALDLLGDLVTRHGQGSFDPDATVSSGNTAFLIADGAESFAVETAGRFWVCQQIEQVRVLGPTCSVRQDWDYIAPGLSAHLIAEERWPADGSKLDFTAACAESHHNDGPALRCWGTITAQLEQQNGRIDSWLLRQLPLEPTAACEPVRFSRFIAMSRSTTPPFALGWFRLGTNRIGLFFPAFVDAGLPPLLRLPDAPATDLSLHRHLEALTQAASVQPVLLRLAAEVLDRHQARIDRDTAEFLGNMERRCGRGDAGRLAVEEEEFGEHLGADLERTIREELADLGEAAFAASALEAEWSGNPARPGS